MPDLSIPRQLFPKAYEKVWGSTKLEPWFLNSESKVGEFWFTEPASTLLIKFLFTTENLSVQVHPNDEQAATMEPGCRGKTEMWHILKAEPGAKLAIGLKRDLSEEELRAACLDGSVMEELRWIPAVAGDTWCILAGTIHAIGAGITLAEIQQNSDVTYRLYDYGRPRELHLEKGLAVSDVRSRPEPAGDTVKTAYFSTKILRLEGSCEVGPGFVIVTAGNGTLDGLAVKAGQVWKVGPEIVAKGECGLVLVER